MAHPTCLGRMRTRVRKSSSLALACAFLVAASLPVLEASAAAPSDDAAASSEEGAAAAGAEPPDADVVSRQMNQLFDELAAEEVAASGFDVQKCESGDAAGLKEKSRGDVPERSFQTVCLHKAAAAV
eukprot:TRINITY_DN5813_c0_g2_i2.p2 TRINITY_DN5813_c0_g2~~TRINITY_DN5813_c0_g2_i2.p2  ORF type:complete len:127 (+),score=43.79 TRINITY_DN5813_c0_g2_i2:86-466(+)